MKVESLYIHHMISTVSPRDLLAFTVYLKDKLWVYIHLSYMRSIQFIACLQHMQLAIPATVHANLKHLYATSEVNTEPGWANKLMGICAFTVYKS